MKSYREALAWLYSLEPRGVRLELDRIAAMLERRGHPERGLRYLHVAGTNGKGSVAAMVASALGETGRLRVGLYTSPHLHRFGERIRIDGAPIAGDEVVRRTRDLRQALEAPGAPELTFFEVTTVMAFEAFRDARCDVVVLEVGLGGRLDATNVIVPEVCAITRIARDHESILGTSLAQIAREKAGILKPGVPAAVAVRDPEAVAAIDEVARAVGAPLVWIDRDFAPDPSLQLRLPGAHQRDNAACAIAALELLRARAPELAPDDAATRRGLSRVEWPGRLEHVGADPDVLLDAAHNPDGCAALAAHLGTLPRARRVLVFASMRDKDHAAMLGVLAPQVDDVIYSALPMPRAASPESLAAIQPGSAAPDPIAALHEASRRAGRGGLVVVAGSIFVMAPIRARLFGLEQDPPIAM